MTTRRTAAALLLGLTAPLWAPATAQNAPAGSAQRPPPERMNFLACPVMRDTEPVPCWLAEHQGELYYLGIQNDISAPFHPPQLRHKALVEGAVSKGPRVCGGIVLEPVNVSVMPELDTTCEKILPAEGHKVDFAPRGPGPANRGQQSATDPNPTPPAPPPAPAPPWRERDMTVRFGFDGLYMNIHNFRVVQEAAAYAKAAGAKSVRVEGYRAASLLSNGQVIAEKSALARMRAEKVGQALRELGVPAASLQVASSEALEPVDGVRDFERRRVRILVTP